MSDAELALRLALVALIREFEKICDAGNKTPMKNPAYREAVKLMEAKSE